MDAGCLSWLRGCSVDAVFIDEIPFGLDQANGDIDVPACCFGIGTRLLRTIQNRLGDLAIQTRQADVKASAERVTVVTRAEIHFSVDDRITLKPHFLLRGNNLNSA